MFFILLFYFTNVESVLTPVTFSLNKFDKIIVKNRYHFKKQTCVDK